ncbi:MAG: hypothetical protein H6727_06840 [Myxococcales bacterium]|nr:hypothetical protein [Myxococcales bacterium]
MFIAYDPDGLLEDALTTPKVPPLPLIAPRGGSSPKKTTPPPFSRMAPQDDFPFLLGDRVRVLDKEHHLAGRYGIITGFISTLHHKREMMCRIFFSCGTSAGIVASALELDPRSQLISDDLLDTVLHPQAPPPQKILP